MRLTVGSLSYVHIKAHLDAPHGPRVFLGMPSPRHGWPVFAFAIVGTLACSPAVIAPGDGAGEGEGEAEGEDGRCTDGNTRPAAPVVVSPGNGSIGVIPEQLVITIGAFEDAEGDLHRGTLFELYRVKSDELELAWRLEQNDPARLKEAALADGELVGDAAAEGALREDEDYVVRVSVRDDSSACNDWSIPSADVTFKTDDGSAFLFDESQVLTFEIDIPPESVELINAQAPSPDCVQYLRDFFPGTFRFQGQTFEGVGVRTKGGCGSSRTLDEKASLKIDLAWDNPNIDGCPEERRLFGQESFTFHNGVQDPTAVHERLGYELYRAAGVPVPRTTTVQLIVNGEPWGVYTHVETFSRRMLSRFFENNDGMMYEGAYTCDLFPENVPFSIEEHSCFTLEFQPGNCNAALPTGPTDPEDWETLRELTNQVAEVAAGESFYPEIEAVFDMDVFISMWAVDSAIQHWDAYSFDVINNYRVYHDPLTDRWTMFPWGIDQTFNTNRDVYPFSSPTILVSQCINDLDCFALMVQRLDEVTVLFEALDYPARAQQLHDQLRDAVYADTRKEYSNEEWEAQHVALQEWIANRPAQLRAFLDEVR